MHSRIGKWARLRAWSGAGVFLALAFVLAPNPVLAQLGSPGGSGALGTYGMGDSRFGGGASPSAANPLISLVLQGYYADFSRTDPVRVPGFAIGDDGAASVGKPGMQLGESELTVYGNIDSYLFGAAVFSLTANTVSVEEAFIQTTALPFGFTAKAGRFHSSIGYLNVLHRHADDFVDFPLAYIAFLNGQLADDGLQVRWLAPTDFLLEFGGESLNGKNFPASGSANRGRGTDTQFIKLGDDIGDSASYLLALSHVDASAIARSTGGDPANNNANALIFDGSSSVNIASLVYKWSPLGNVRYSQFKFIYEYFSGDEHGTYAVRDSTGAPSGTADLRGGKGAVRAGWYAQAVYKFHERWRVGLRQSEVTTERISDPAAAGTQLSGAGHAPAVTSAMAEFWPSDFSQFRVQYSSDQTQPGKPLDRWYLQYLVALGAHGAHSY